MCNENRIGRSFGQRFFLQIVKQPFGAANGAQIEHHACKHLCFGVWRFDPPFKVVAPLRHRLPPARIDRHHITGAVHVSTRVEPVADQAGKRLKIWHIGIGHAVVEKQTIVLIADTGLFLPPLRSASEPEVGDRGRSKLGFRQSNQAAGCGVGHIGDAPCDYLVPVAACYKLRQQLRDARGDFGHGLGRIGMRDLRHQLGRADRLKPGQVGLRDDAHEFASF